MRYGRRLADRLHASWTAVYIETSRTQRLPTKCGGGFFFFLFCAHTTDTYYYNSSTAINHKRCYRVGPITTSRSFIEHLLLALSLRGPSVDEPLAGPTGEALGAGKRVEAARGASAVGAAAQGLAGAGLEYDPLAGRVSLGQRLAVQLEKRHIAQLGARSHL